MKTAKKKNKKIYVWKNKKTYQNQWLRNRRLDWIKENGPCKHCGSWDNLEVDHIDRSKKKWDGNRIWCRKKELRDAELANCQVLCKSCHLKKTKEENKQMGHGTPVKYDTCKCSVCKRTKKLHEKNKKN
jgi:5-methylcytosine-specific restriction endonuclease McrA